ncbi:hypothetical protein ACSVIA_20425 [Rhodococcus erythropolis]|uniref:hypothetical protein n=1 Tax=Rhodococcus erythropolis TaxID=1833 RepID=UPI00404386AD
MVVPFRHTVAVNHALPQGHVVFAGAGWGVRNGTTSPMVVAPSVFGHGEDEGEEPDGRDARPVIGFGH